MWGFSGFLIQCSCDAFISIGLRLSLPFTRAIHKALWGCCLPAPCSEAGKHVQNVKISATLRETVLPGTEGVGAPSTFPISEILL